LFIAHWRDGDLNGFGISIERKDAGICGQNNRFIPLRARQKSASGDGTLDGNPAMVEGWSQWPGLNRRPTVYETVALPLSYIGFQRALHTIIIERGESRKFHCAERLSRSESLRRYTSRG
jgi:hypothetical protein